VRHHNRWVQGCEVKSGDGFLVETSGGLYNDRSFVLPFVGLNAIDGNEQVEIPGFTIQLTGHFDLLTTRKQECYGHARDARHFGQVEETHEFFHESQGQVGVFDAIDSQSPARELVFLLQLRNDTKVHVFFLLP
jgi:hypothetical protein